MNARPTLIELSYTRPSEIDGEPSEVRELTVQQLREVAGAVGELAIESSVQIRGAGLTGDPDRHATVVDLDDWLQTDEAAACLDLVVAARKFIAAAKSL